mmetsp:Transcript_26235/g.52577  ORF Transcript_26235/g.52577 Transcript_26235/m.52577 type:complete len:244 (-) Transcript_26235:250-981(-)
MGPSVNLQSLVPLVVVSTVSSFVFWATRPPPVSDKGWSDEDYSEAAELAAEAFRNAPGYMWFGGNSEWRKVQLKWFFNINFRMQQQKGNVCRLFRNANGKAVCFFMLQPACVTLSLGETLWVLFCKLLPRYGFAVFGRLIKMVGALEKKKLAALKAAGVDERQCMTLERMVVSPSFQGQGVGTKHLGETLRAEAQESVVVLTTQEERNVRFYQRFGFTVAGEGHVEGLGRNWVMVRKPTSAPE